MNVGDHCYCDPQRFPFGKRVAPVRVQILQSLAGGYYVGVTHGAGNFDPDDPRRTEFWMQREFLNPDPAVFTRSSASGHGDGEVALRPVAASQLDLFGELA